MSTTPSSLPPPATAQLSSGRISLEQAAAINEALNGLPTGLDKTQQQRLADALCTLVTAADAVEKSAASGSHSPVNSSSPRSSAVSVPTGAAQLMVVIPYEQLLDRACERGVLMDGTTVSPGELRLLACQADLIPVVLGTDSTVLDVGRVHRLAPPALRLAVALRDGGCAFPGCTMPMWHCDVHHVTPGRRSDEGDRLPGPLGITRGLRTLRSRLTSVAFSGEAEHRHPVRHNQLLIPVAIPDQPSGEP